MGSQLTEQASEDKYDLAHLSASSPRNVLDGRRLIEVKETPGKGLGIFATVQIPRGTRIIAESPLLRATAFSTYCVDVQDSFERLSSAKQRAYLQLHGYASPTLKKDNNWASLPELNRKVLAIYTANRWGRDVFWLASRFNHSCIPNVHNAYNPIIRMETFHSTRDIEAGEELTISYISGISVRHERQAQLKSWGFQCSCSACKDTPEGNMLERQLCQLALLSHGLEIGAPSTLSFEKKLGTHGKMAALLRSVGHEGKLLHQCYVDAAFCSAVLGNVQMAMLWTAKELEVNNYCLGQDHPDCQKEAGVLKQLQNAAASNKKFHYSQINWILDWDLGPE